MSETLTSATTLILSGNQRKTIAEHAEQAYPDECCGVMLGRQDGDRRIVEELLEIDNQWDEHERRRRFLISAPQFMQAEKQARERSLDLLGFYHSHPDAPARPSDFDREHAWPWYAYPIASVENGKIADLRAWQLRNDRSTYDEIAIASNQGGDSEDE